MEGFRFFEVFPADGGGGYQPHSAACLLAAGNNIPHGELKERGGKILWVKKIHTKISCNGEKMCQDSAH